MNVLMVRSKVKQEHVAEVEAAVEKLFSAISEAQPKGVRYASSKLPDGVTFVALLELDTGLDNPLPGLPAFREFQENLKNWVAEPPVPEQLEVIGSYRLFDRRSGSSAGYPRLMTVSCDLYGQEQLTSLV